MASAPASRLPSLWPVFAVSCGILGFEIGLMRMLLFASWHHFAFLVISVALLGFGASGTVLTFLRARLVGRSASVIEILVIATAVSMPVSVQILQYLPVETHVLPVRLTSQAGLWIVYWTILTIPFMLGASAVGLTLMTAGDRLPTVYAANLAGSALGAVCGTVIMHIAPPAWFGAVMGTVTLLGAAAPWPGKGKSKPQRRQSNRGERRGVSLFFIISVVVTVLWIWFSPPSIRTDPFKYRTYLKRLEADGRAAQIGVAYGPRATIEAYRSAAFHELPFLSVEASPPAMAALVSDGHWTASVLDVATADEAEVMDRTLTAVPYALIDSLSRVLLLGEAGGANVWLAARRQASEVHVAQPDKNLIRLMRGPLNAYGGRVFDLPGVEIHAAEPRHFVEHGAARYDMIQLVSMESWTAATGGLEGLNQDHLMTVEGMVACLRRLTPDGILFVARGIQLPPRDNVKILATFIEALRHLGVKHPDRHIAIVRDYLGVCTMARMRPWMPAEIAALRRLCAERSLTPVYFTGILPEELNHPDAMPGPPDGPGDWLHHAAVSLFSEDASRFFDTWPSDVRPATDDRPFFANFSRPDIFGTVEELSGDHWPGQAELALLFVAAAMMVITISGALLTALPLLLIRDIRQAPGLGATAGYFTAIGLAYMTLEITALSRMDRLLGDPVQAGAATIAGFLLFSGLGSLAAQKIGPDRMTTVRRLMLVLVLTGLLEWRLIDLATALAGSWPLGGRFAVGMAVIAPMGFLMGFPMPAALARVKQAAPALVPWAWGLNGFASVLASPLATAVGMTAGFRTAGALALGCYLAAAVLIGRTPGKEQASGGRAV